MKDLRLHYERLHQIEKNFSCEDCGMKFKTKANASLHFRVHHLKNNLRFSCTFCDKKFIFESELTKHLQVSHTENRIKCDICGELFRPGSMPRHKKRVHENKQFGVNCPECNKTIADKRKLQGHIREVHENIKDFKCHLCKKEFKRKFHLHEHIDRQHNIPRKEHKCDNCEKTFNVKYDLETHVENVYIKSKAIQCAICQKRFKHKINLHKHNRTFHQVEQNVNSDKLEL